MEGEKSLAWVAGGIVCARNMVLAEEPLIEVLLPILLSASHSLLAAMPPKLYYERLQYRQLHRLKSRKVAMILPSQND